MSTINLEKGCNGKLYTVVVKEEMKKGCSGKKVRECEQLSVVKVV